MKAVNGSSELSKGLEESFITEEGREDYFHPELSPDRYVDSGSDKLR